MRRYAIAPLLATLLAASPAFADLVRITDRGTFVAAVQGRDLSRLGISLNVAPNGSISGRALGRNVTGSWTWEDSMFCRTLDAGDRQYGRNCQVVSADADNIRFHADQGMGDIADFNIR